MILDLVVPVAAGLGSVLVALTTVVIVFVVLYHRRRKTPSAITDEVVLSFQKLFL